MCSRLLFWSHKLEYYWCCDRSPEFPQNTSRSGSGRETDRVRSPTCWVLELVIRLAGVYFSAQFPFLEMFAFPPDIPLWRDDSTACWETDIVPLFATQCSKSCQGGFRVREVRCLSDDMTPGSLCDPQLKPEERESCNPQDCVPEVGEFGVPIWEKRERGPL